MNTSARMIVQIPVLALAGMLFAAPVLAQKDDLPAQTEEGLVRQESKRLDVVYWRPGATRPPSSASSRNASCATPTSCSPAGRAFIARAANAIPTFTAFRTAST